MCQVSRLLQRWCFCSRDSQTHWCWVKGKQTWNVKALWTYLELEQDAFMELSAGSELVLDCYLFWRRSVGRFKSNCPVRAGVDVKNIYCISLFLVCIHQCIRSCSYLMLFQAFCIGDVFSCVLGIKLQSTRVHMYKREVLEWWVTWLVLDSDGLGEAGASFLITRFVIIFLFSVTGPFVFMCWLM